MSVSDKFLAACVQLRTGQDVKQNIDQASELVRDAARQGAQFIATPEMTHLMELSGKPLFEKAKTEDEDPGVRDFGALAKDLGVWLLIGSLAIRLSEDKVANRSYLFRPDGDIQATYDKIHMFDVDLKGGESYRESKHYQAGSQAVVAETPWGELGMTVCYDLRFPYLHRKLAHEGAAIFLHLGEYTVEFRERVVQEGDEMTADMIVAHVG